MGYLTFGEVTVSNIRSVYNWLEREEHETLDHLQLLIIQPGNAGRFAEEKSFVHFFKGCEFYRVGSLVFPRLRIDGKRIATFMHRN
jgi:hypothetical protein